MTNRSRSGLGILVLLALCAAVGGWYAIGRARASTAPTGAATGGGTAKSVPVAAVTVSKRDVPIYLDGLGTVQAYYTVTIRSQIDGQLLKFELKEGQEVRKGDLVALIDPQPFHAQLEMAIAKKKQDEGKKLQDLAKVRQDQAKVLQDQAKKAQDNANLANARVNLKRNEDSYQANAVTEQSVEDQRSLVNQLVALVLADDAAIQSDEAAVKADEASVQADEAFIEADEAAIRYQQTQLAYTRIVSPIDGRVGVRLVDPGNIVRANDANGIAVITQLKPISVLFTLPQQDLLPINERMAKDRLPVFAYDSTGKTELDRGTLELVDNLIDPATGTIRLKATFPNASLKLWPGGFVNVRLLLDTRRDAVVVSAPAVQQGPEGTFVFVIKSDQTVDARPVKVALIQDGEAVLENGLEPGEQVVLSGQDRLKVGAKVDVHQPKSGEAKSGDAKGEEASKSRAPKGEHAGKRKAEEKKDASKSPADAESAP